MGKNNNGSGWGWNDPPRTPKRRSPMDSGNNRSDKSCCHGAAAVNAVKKRKFRLARRHTILMVRALAARAVA